MRFVISCIFLCLLSSFCALSTAHAQSLTSGDNELYISEGILSIDELIGIGGQGAPSPYMSFPSSITGAAFLTYRHNFTKRFSLGFTAGLDNQRGDLSYGDEHHGSFQGTYYGTSGFYTRHAYTFAVEAKFNYVKTRRFTLYGYVGAGYTFENTKYTFFQGIQDPDFFYGTSNSLVPTNPYTENFSHINADLTPVGMRFGGDLAGFFELGIGYKGLLSGGLSYRF